MNRFRHYYKKKHLRRLLLVVPVVAALGVSTVQAQEATLDWKMHDAGKIRQVITNMGAIWQAETNYPGLIYSEFPPGSHVEHVGEGGFWIGSITEQQDTLVSVADSWNSPFEFYPTAEPYDTVWVAEGNDTLDIPYWPGEYTPKSDQDFVCRYVDYGAASEQVTAHQPLDVEVIQTSYAYASPPLDEMVIYKFHVIPKEEDLNDAYFAYFLDGNVGYRSEGWEFALDDYSVYKEDRNLGIAVDAEGGVDGKANSPIGIQMFPPDGVNEDQLEWSFNWYPGQGAGGPPSRDPERYQQMAADNIQRDQENPVGSQFMISMGPVNIAYGDTMTFTVAQLHGQGMDELLNNSDLASFLVRNDFQVPSSPPSPDYTVTTSNRQVTIDWSAPDGGQTAPEAFVDSNRSTYQNQPFEGYRVYKSSQSSTGPWTLLAEFDISGNPFRYDTGLEYKFEDDGLMNNVEYYYSVTAFTKPDSLLDWPSLESSVNANSREVVPGTAPPGEVGEVAAVPNPYRADQNYDEMDPPWESPPESRDRWLPQDRKLQFINVPSNSTIKIYTTSGNLVQTLEHKSQEKGYVNWNLTSSVGQAISSGIYLFTVKNNDTGEVQSGKFVVIK